MIDICFYLSSDQFFSHLFFFKLINEKGLFPIRIIKRERFIMRDFKMFTVMTTFYYVIVCMGLVKLSLLRYIGNKNMCGFYKISIKREVCKIKSNKINILVGYFCNLLSDQKPIISLNIYI